jgi:hypothetical protein
MVWFIDSPKNQIEIWYDAKKSKNYIADIDQVTFPKLQQNKIETKVEYSPSIYVEQQAIGFVASYELNIESFFWKICISICCNLMTNCYCNNLPTPTKTTFEKKGNIAYLPEWF